VSIRSPLSLLRCNEYNPSAFNLCSYGILLKSWTSFVALLWIFSMHSNILFEVWIPYLHTVFQMMSNISITGI